MKTLKNGIVLMTTDFTAKQWRGLGLRTAVKIKRLDTDRTHSIGPLQYRQDVYNAINRFSDTYPNVPFNVYCYGQYIGGTEV